MIRSPELVCKILEQSKGTRQHWEPHWQEIGDYMVPRKNDINNFKSPGTKRNLQIYDNTGMNSVETLTGMLHGTLINPMSEFFEMTTGDYELDQDPEVRHWQQDSTSRMHRILNNSNFQTESYEYMLDLVSFNTAAQTILEDENKIVFFQTHYLKEIYIREDSRGSVNELDVVNSKTARDLVEEYGKENCPKWVLEALEKNSEEKFELIQSIYPCDHVSGKKDKKFRFPIVSQHILTRDKHQLRLAGFEERPWNASRWAKASGETYGRGPGMNALPAVKLVNLMEEVSIKGAQLTIAPPVQMPDDGYGKLRVKPYGVNHYRAGSKDRIETIFGDTRIDYSIEIMNAHRQRIEKSFYVDQVQLPQKLDRATREEIVTRNDQGGRFLGPLLSRMDVEWLGPTFDRAFGICYRRKQFLPVPRKLEGRPVYAKFSSAIAKLQRMGEVRNLLEFYNTLSPLAAIDPRVVQIIDPDASAYGIAHMMSYPQKFLRTPDALKKLREQEAALAEERAKAEQEMHQAEVANKTAPAVTAAQQVAQQGV